RVVVPDAQPAAAGKPEQVRRQPDGARGPPARIEKGGAADVAAERARAVEIDEVLLRRVARGRSEGRHEPRQTRVRRGKRGGAVARARTCDVELPEAARAAGDGGEVEARLARRILPPPPVRDQGE